MERAMGFEPTTSCLGSKHSTTELRPLALGSVLHHIITAGDAGIAKPLPQRTDYPYSCSSSMRLSCTLAQCTAHSSRVARSVLPET